MIVTEILSELVEVFQKRDLNYNLVEDKIVICIDSLKKYSEDYEINEINDIIKEHFNKFIPNFQQLSEEDYYELFNL